MYKLGCVACFFLIFVPEVRCGTSCASTNVVDQVNTLSRTITAMQAQLPPLNFSDQTVVAAYGQVLQAVCTTNRTLLDQLELEVAKCPQIIFAAQDLQAIQLFGKGFAAFYEEFSDIDEFCGCSPYLMHAWTFKDTMEKAFMGNNDTAVSNISIAMGAYCSSDAMKSTLDSLVENLRVCRRLPAQAGLVTDYQLMEIRAFIYSRCSVFTPASIRCAEVEALNVNFTACYANATFNVSDAGEMKRCGRRECVREYIEPKCSSVGRDLYVYSVNLQRNTTAETIKRVDCDEEVNGADFSRISTLAALGTVLLYMLNM